MALRVLDTDHLSLFQRGHPAILPRIQELPATRIAIGIVSVEEMLQGRLAQVRRASTGKERVRAYAWLEKTMAFFRGFRVLPFDTREIPTSFFLVKRVRLFRLLNTVVCPWFPWSVPGFPGLSLVSLRIERGDRSALIGLLARTGIRGLSLVSPLFPRG